MVVGSHPLPSLAPESLRIDSRIASRPRVEKPALRPASNRRSSAARIRKSPSQFVSPFQKRLAAGEPCVPAEGNREPGYHVAKRAFGIAGALAVLVVLSPVMLTVLLVLMVTTRGKPIFRQVRLGLHGRPFVLYKFRTMVVDAEKRRHEVANEHSGPIFKNRRDPRITPFGQFLRRTSLDETPQLFNVLAGHMSLVGPRPPLASEVARYSPWQRRRLAVRPGLTCLWQVSGRSEIGFDDWARMDLWYIRNQNLRTDLGLLLKTPLSVLSGRGAY
jgi:lipopolysaccharide/colanic/teichoic acid biosynthesis glycosyltransferase